MSIPLSRATSKIVAPSDAVTTCPLIVSLTVTLPSFQKSLKVYLLQIFIVGSFLSVGRVKKALYRSFASTNAENFTSILTFEENPLVNRQIHTQSTRAACLHTTTAVPTFVRVYHKRRLTLVWIGKNCLYSTDISAGIATNTNFRVNGNCHGGAGGIRHNIYLLFRIISIRQRYSSPFSNPFPSPCTDYNFQDK